MVGQNYTDILDQFYLKKDDASCSTAFDLCQIDARLLPGSEVCEVGLGPEPVWQTCEKWTFDHTLYESTATADFQLVCQNRYLNTIATSIFYFGYAVGGVTGGLLADKFGRKYVSIMMILGLGTADIILAFSSNIQFFIIMRFMIGFFLNGMMVTAFTMCMEFISKKYRGAMGCWFCSLFAVGTMLVSYPLAVLVKDWRVMQKWLSCLCWPIAVLWFLYVPESYKWLISKSKSSQAHEIARFCMSKNRPNSDAQDEIELQQTIDEKVDEVKNYPNSSINNLFSNKNMLFVTVICGYNWFVCSLGFYGAGLNAGILPGSTILNNAIMGFMELPALLLSSFLMEIKWLGRVRTSAISHISGGIVLILSSYLLSLNDCPDQKDPPGVNMPASKQWALVFAFLGKLFFSACFGVIYSYTAEIYPAEIRSNGLGVCGFFSRVAGLLTPYILETKGYFYWMPGCIFGFCGITCGFLTLLLPETLGKNLYASIEETEVEYFNKKKRIHL